jgi:hypothetical protein
MYKLMKKKILFKKNIFICFLKKILKKTKKNKNKKNKKKK